MEPQQRSPLLEVRGNVELKRPLVKAPSRLPLPGTRFKRGPDRMEDALEPEKKRTRGLDTVTKIATSHPRPPALTVRPQTQSQTTAPKVPKKTGPRCSTTIGTVLKKQKPDPAVPAQKPGAAAPPTLGGKKPTKRPAWDLKGQLCDLNAELKCCRERTQTLNQENQQLQDQLKEAQQQARVLGAECRTLEGELARVQAQAEQGQQELGNLRARVLELEEQLGTQQGLVQELQKEQVGLQEERRGLAARLEEQERRLQASEVALSGSQAEVASLRQEAATQATLLVAQGERLHGLEMERRRLHNQLQELKGNIRVFCRVRPVLPGEPTPSPGFLLFPSGPGGSSDTPTRLSISRSDERRGTLSGTPAPTTRHDFSFDRVFPPGSGQDQVFEEIAMLVQSALDGYPVCIFAYGQTGSGKTFTMEGGPGGEPQVEGLIPRALRHLFSVAQELGGQGWTYSFVASYVEIYNETVRDLLATGTRKGQGSECEIRRAGPGSEELTVTNARYVPVSCEKEESHVPYRNSKLTYLLQNSLGGSAKMLMFVNISPLEENVSESLNSLRFASKVNQCVIGTAQANRK
ncbi:kinesin-like protein KIFC1 isoform X2 [Mustela nigripes]|uniref:kinesin-like protein KIFC1 isoform X2 n=1 Tax=Mustela nigripes TaxID=77151 RepID=UPI0028151123|nr:kinesin-like protein KIFC1 isoform X2 [Mustela nigripes]